MSNVLLYTITVLIWGSTWLAVKYQLGVVAVEVSIVYRFALASLVLMLYCLSRGKSLRLGWRAHLWMIAFGACLFCGNPLFIYMASGYIPTGLVSVGFGSIVVMNIVLSRLFFKTTISSRVVAGAGLGMIGIVLVFWPQVEHVDLSDRGFFGMLMVLSGALLASLGNMISTRTQKDGLPVVQANAWGMAYGAFFTALFAAAKGVDFTFDPHFEYIWSLLYLSIFGSVIAFGAYMTLLGNIGPQRAVYSVVLFPLVALSLSTVFEDYHWPLAALTGVPLVLWGNVLVLTKTRTLRRFPGFIVQRLLKKPA